MTSDRSTSFARQARNTAIDAGYAGTSAFIAAFKKMFGTAPAHYSVS